MLSFKKRVSGSSGAKDTFPAEPVSKENLPDQCLCRLVNLMEAVENIF